MISLTILKSLIVLITTDCEQLLKKLEYLTTLFVSWETCMLVKKQQLELDMKQGIGSKLGRWYDKDVPCHPAYLASMQCTLCEMLGWMSHKLESRFLGDSNLRGSDNATLMAESEEDLRSLLMRVKEESAKTDLNLNIQKNKIRACSPITSWWILIEGEKVGAVIDFIFLGSKIPVDCAATSYLKSILHLV